MQIDESWDDLHFRTSGSDLTFRVLGPLEVRAADGLVHVGGPQIRALLALLLVRPGHVISLSTLVASLWSTDAPPSAERTARTYMSRLRLALAPLAAPAPAGSLIVTTPPGYLLRADPMSVDASLFEQLTVAGRRALAGNDPQTARTHLCNALRLWRGDAFAEFTDVAVLRAEASRLEELRLSALENRLQSELSLGLGPDLVAELDGLVTAHPLRERLWVQYLTALYRAGRQAEALSAYQRARALLADELGLEPSVELADTHRRILAQDPALLPEMATVSFLAPAVRVTAPVGTATVERTSRQWEQRRLAPQVTAGLDAAAFPKAEAFLEAAAPPQAKAPPEAAASPEAEAPPEAESLPVANRLAPQKHRQPAPADWPHPLPAGVRMLLAAIAQLLARPRVSALATRLGRGLVALGRAAGRLARAVPARARAWWGWDTVDSCPGISHRPRG